MAWYDEPIDDEKEQLGSDADRSMLGPSIPTPLNRQGPDLQAMPSPAPDNAVPAPDTSTRQRVVPGMPLPPDGAGIPPPEDSTPKAAKPTTYKEKVAQSLANVDALSRRDASYYGRDPDTGKQDSTIKSIGKGLLLAMQNIAPIMLDKNVSDKTALGYALGASLAGSISNVATHGGAYGNVKLAQDKKEAQEQVDKDTKNELTDAQAQLALSRPGMAEDANNTKIQVARERAQSTLANINRRADVKAGEAKPVVNEYGQLELQFLHADSKGNRKPNELQLGADKQPITIPGEEGVEWEDPLTHVKTILKAKQAATSDATIAGGNAQREQQGTEFNITQRRLIDEANAKAEATWNNENTKAEIEWHNRNANRMIEIAKAQAVTNPDLQGIYGQMASAQSTMQRLSDEGGANSPVSATAFAKAQKEFWDANKAFQDAVVKQQNGQQIVQAMQSALEGKPQRTPKPPKIEYGQVQPAQVSGGTTGKGRYSGMIFASPQSLQSHFPGKSPAEIKAIVEGQGGTFR